MDSLQYIIEYMDCNSQKIKKVEVLEPILLEATKKSKATIINYNFHQFQPNGVSGVILIAESHVSIHTWPEHNYAAVDIFTCGNQMKPEIIMYTLKEEIMSKRWEYQILKRGLKTYIENK